MKSLSELKNDEVFTKVPEVTLIFWIIKIASTTLGETAGDAVSMSMNLGYLVSSLIFGGIFVISVSAQISIKKLHPLIYWFTIICTTTVGTTIADYFDRSLGIGYTGGVTILFVLLLTSLFAWHKVTGTVSVSSITSYKSEAFYWITIMFSQTLGTALGDWTADSASLGYLGGIAIFSSVLVCLIIAYYSKKVSTTLLFWCAFIITRPLGAVVGDFLDKPIAQGGLNLSRYSASISLIVFIVLCILIFPQRASKVAH
jgi:uncharacterized membrane-anchored protein